MAQTPFNSLEAAHEYVGLLLDAVQETRADVAGDVAEAPPDADGARRREALQLVTWKLERLETHLAASRRLLNDLRRLRRLLLGDTEELAPKPDAEEADDPLQHS